jgi:putative acetyltransferase
MNVREFRTEDSDSLADLFFQTVRQIDIRDYSPAQVEAWAPKSRDLAKWRKSFAGKMVFVSEENGKILGFGELESTGHIDRFYIDADHVGHGVGRAIYEKIEHEARSRNISRLFAEASITAKPFFERMGFFVLKEQTVNVQGVGMNNFVMEKSLVK